MNRKSLLIILLMCSVLNSFAEEKDDPGMNNLTQYGLNYFVMGLDVPFGDFSADSENIKLNDIGINTQQLVKVGISFKVELFPEIKLGFYLGYTQTMFWDFFNKSGSAPFVETLYNPDFFWRFESGHNFAGDLYIPVFDYFQLGIEHKSNGISGDTSRAFDRIYAKLQVSYGNDWAVGLSVKYFWMTWMIHPDFTTNWDSTNQDIQDYMSSWEFQAFVKVPYILHEIRVTGGPGGGAHAFDIENGWLQADVTFMGLFGLRPYAQIWLGYGESMVGYDQQSFSIRVGAAITY